MSPGLLILLAVGLTFIAAIGLGVWTHSAHAFLFLFFGLCACGAWIAIAAHVLGRASRNRFE